MGEQKTKQTKPPIIISSRNEALAWDRRKVEQTLREEAQLDRQVAQMLSQEIEKTVMALPMGKIPSSLIREIINVKVASKGLLKAQQSMQRLGLSMSDINQLFFPSQVRSDFPEKNSTAIDYIISEKVKREFALRRVFDDDVTKAHTEGDIYIDGLENIDRLYSSTQSVEYLKKYGLDIYQRLPASKPAKRPEVFISQLVKFTQTLKHNFYGPIGWDGVNIFFSAFFEKMSDHVMAHLAQDLIYEISQNAGIGGVRPLNCDFHLYWEVPKHLENVIAIGGGGKMARKTYLEYAVESQRFLWTLLKALERGDGSGQPFITPNPFVHVTQKFFTTPGSKDFLKLMAKVAAEKGAINFVFDRENTTLLNHCGKFDFTTGRALMKATEPWKIRYQCMQNVTLNLPRVAIKSKRSTKAFFIHLQELLELALKAHNSKKDFIFELLRQGVEGPFPLLTTKKGGKAFLLAENLFYMVSVCGLNETIQLMTGKQIHECEKSAVFANKILVRLNKMLAGLSESHQINVILGSPPNEQPSYFFAHNDLKAFSNFVEKIVKGDMKSGAPYYTHSIGLNIEQQLDPMKRLKIEGILQSQITGGDLMTLYLNGIDADLEKIQDLIYRAFKETKIEQLTFAPDFTRCFQCGTLVKGLQSFCPNEDCHSNKVDGLSKQMGKYIWLSNFTRENLYNFFQRYDNSEYLANKENS